MKFKSPRPHAMVIYKRNPDTDWQAWAYFSSNCYTYFGMPYSRLHRFTRPDEVVCREEYSTLEPLYDGEVIFSVIKGRPGYDQFFANEALQAFDLHICALPVHQLAMRMKWSTASQIKIALRKAHTFGDERNAEKDTLLTYYFAVSKLAVGGRCLCHGHGNRCVRSEGPGFQGSMVCMCHPSHHTEGDNCEICAPGYMDKPWAPATPYNANHCRGKFVDSINAFYALISQS
ncbi:unnamed protein product [Protopolystoma xenopodis]|uniref:Laminin N-terminal domain-containing protein n=1 Tax=Protopolystoma xenopodis TaxID=117903 RepID=A0A3S5CSZ4_9PLAT|nr:unnamed protein product [Protopolystoma xenopodis]